MNIQRFQWLHGLRCIDEQARRANVLRLLSSTARVARPLRATPVPTFAQVVANLRCNGLDRSQKLEDRGVHFRRALLLDPMAAVGHNKSLF